MNYGFQIKHRYKIYIKMSKLNHFHPEKKIASKFACIPLLLFFLTFLLVPPSLFSSMKTTPTMNWMYKLLSFVCVCKFSFIERNNLKKKIKSMSANSNLLVSKKTEFSHQNVFDMVRNSSKIIAYYLSPKKKIIIFVYVYPERCNCVRAQEFNCIDVDMYIHISLYVNAK